MKSKDIKQQKTILATTPEEWDARINAALANLPECKCEPNIVRERTADGFMAVIEYYYTDRVPEDIIDEFALRGIHYYCEDCPHLRLASDKRVKWHDCDLGMKHLTQKSSIACEWYYEQIKKAEVEK